MKLALTTLGVTVLACAALAAGAAASRGGGRLFLYRGEVLAASSTSVQVRIDGGNRAGLRSLVGEGQNQTFAVDSHTEVLLWSKGIPTVGGTADLHAGDWVQVRVRGRGNPASVISDRRQRPVPPARPLFLFVGTVAGPQAGGRIALHVRAGNRHALRLLLGQPTDQTFTYDDGTIFLLWQGKVPTVIDPSRLRAGDRITIRIRAPRGSTLAQVEATPAVHVGDREPAGR